MDGSERNIVLARIRAILRRRAEGCVRYKKVDEAYYKLAQAWLRKHFTRGDNHGCRIEDDA